MRSAPTRSRTAPRENGASRFNAAGPLGPPVVVDVQRRPGADVDPRERIRRRAFEIYLARGGRPGDALSDWLQAEREASAARTEALEVETVIDTGRGERLLAMEE